MVVLLRYQQTPIWLSLCKRVVLPAHQESSVLVFDQELLLLQKKKYLQQPKWLGYLLSVCPMDTVNEIALGCCNLPVTLNRTYRAVEAFCGLQGIGNNSELGEELSALPIKSISSSSCTAGAVQLTPAPAHPTWVITHWNAGQNTTNLEGEDRGEEKFSTST